MKQLENWRGVYLNDTELASYIEVGFYQVDNDYNRKNLSDQIKYIEVPAKQCDLGDFDNNQTFFDQWAGDYSIICPVVKPSGFQGFQLEGSPAEMVSKNFGFYV